MSLKRKIFTIINVVVFCVLFSQNAYSITVKRWVSATASNWNVAANWSPAGVPTTTDSVIFDGGGLGNCTINATVSVWSIEITSAYTGTVTQNAFSITLGDTLTTSGFKQNGGTFVGGSKFILDYGSMILTGGTFTSTSDTLFIYANDTVTTTFNHNNGKVLINASAATARTNYVYGSHTLYKFSYRVNNGGTQAYLDIDPSTILTVTDTLNIDGTVQEAINRGKIYAKKHMKITNTGGFNLTYVSGTGTIVFNGTGTQKIIGPSGGFATFGQGMLPNIEINTDTLQVIDTITAAHDWTYVRGVMKTTTGLVGFVSVGAVTGTHHLSRVQFSRNTTTLTTGTNWYVDSVMYVGPSPAILYNDTIFCINGSRIETFCGANTFGGGTTWVDISGTGTQKIIGNSAINGGCLPNILVDKASTDSLIITSNSGNFVYKFANVEGDWVYKSGIVTGDGIIGFSSPLANQAISSAAANHLLTIPNVAFAAPTLTTYNKNIPSTDTLVVPGDVVIFGSGGLKINGGVVNDQGNVICRSQSVNSGGTGTIMFSGSSTQYFYCYSGTLYPSIGNGSAPLGYGATPNIVINKSSGTLFFNDSITTRGNWTYIKGTVDASSLGSVRAFAGNGYFVNGTGTGGTMAFDTLVIADNNIRTVNGDFNVQSQLDLKGGYLDLNSKRVKILNNWTSAVKRDTGLVFSETTPVLGYGILDWQIGNAPVGSSFVFPFGSKVYPYKYIPFTFAVQTVGSAGGSMAVSTYPTAWTASPNNLPYPTGVTNINNIILGISNSSKEIDRYWVTTPVSYTATPRAQLTFAYRDSEWRYTTNAINENLLQVHHWNSGASAWTQVTGTSTRDTTNNYVSIPSQDTFSVFTLVDPEALHMTIAANDSTVCTGDCVNFRFGSVIPAPQSYSWSFPGGTPSTSTDSTPTCIKYNAAGSYTVYLTGTYPGGNILRDTFTNFITARIGPTIRRDSTNVLCFGASTGRARDSVLTGTGPFTFHWSGGGTISGAATYSQYSNLSAGTYKDTIADGTGCVVLDSFRITQPSTAVTASITGHTNVTCNGLCNGALTATASGGTGAISFHWNSGQTTGSINGLCAGNYVDTVKDANGCTVILRDTITQPTAVTASISSQTNVTCNGSCNGAATITASGGTGTITHHWSNGGGTASLTGLCAGVFVDTVRDGNGCQVLVTVTITQPTALASTVTTHTNITCNGSCNGVLTVTPSGGTGPSYTHHWSTGATTASITGLCAGNYADTVRDANGCSQIVRDTITQPTVLVGTISTHNNVSCNGLCDGSITVTPSGGTGPSYTHHWNTGPTTATLSNLCAGNYADTVRDANGCITIVRDTITQPTALTASVTTHTNVTCVGQCNGVLTVTPAGGTAGYTHHWSNGATTATNSSLCVGNYADTVRDAHGCQVIVRDTITQPANPLVASVTAQSNVSCNGLCDGSILVTASGGTTPYNHHWTNGATTSTISNLCAGVYNDTITDANGCSVIVRDTITQPIALTAIVSAQTNVSCNGVCNGTVTVTAAGGSGAITHHWSNGASTSVLSSLCAGAYVDTVRDANGCQVLVRDTITQPVALTASVTAHTNASCFGVCDGSLTVTPAGGTLPYHHHWSNGDTTATIINLCASTHIFVDTIRDANGCSVQVRDTIFEPTALTASVTAQTNVSCFGVCDGSATVTVSGGTSAYIHHWSNGQTTATATNLCAGNYADTVIDAHGCQTIVHDTITQPVQLTASVTTHTNVSCFGVCDGKLIVTVAGGTTPYTHHWSNGASIDTITSLCAGIYSDTIVDAHGCQVLLSDTITQPVALTGSVTAHTNISCFGVCDGSITVLPAGGTGPYTHRWSNGQTSATVTSLCAGNYTDTIIDAHACQTIVYDTITQPTALTATVTTHTNVTCVGLCNGVLGLTVSGGTSPYTFSWSTGATTDTITGLCVGTYTGTITDAHGCTTTVTDSITQPANPLVASVTSHTDASCNGVCDGAITATASGGTAPYLHRWTNGDTTTTVINLCAGVYNDTITDANGCFVIVRDTITEPTLLTVSVTSHTDVSCNGVCDGILGITAAGGTTPYTYSWSNAATTDTINGLCAGVYTVTVTDAHGCSATINDTITEPPLLTATITASTNASCNGTCDGTATASGNGGTGPYTYSWSNGGTTDTTTNLCAGIYTVTVTDAHGCTATVDDTITEPTVLVANIISSTDASCNGTCNGTATASGSGGTPPYTYSWNTTPGQTDSNAVNLCAGTYDVTVTDANGCTATVSDTINEPTLLTASITAQANVTCNGLCDGSATVDAQGGTAGYTYTWGTTPPQNGPTATNLCAGIYTVTITDANNCTTTINDTITEPTLLTVTGLSHTDASCNGTCDGGILVTGAGGTPSYTYNWSNAATTDTIDNLCAGVYIVTVTDFNGCTATLSDTITEPPLLTATITASTNASCNGTCDGTATASGNGGTAPYTYSWSNGGTSDTTNSLCAGVYTVTVTDAHGCTATVNDTITEPPVLAVTITSSIDASCNGSCDGTAVATATGGTSPYVFSWSNGALGDTAQNLCAGTYDVTVTDANGCTATVSDTINEPPVLTISITAQTDVSCFGVCDGTATATANGGTGPYSFNWSNGTASDTATALCAGTYTVTVTDAHGCTATVDDTITEPTVLTVAEISHSDASCNGTCDGGILVTGNGGTTPYTYSWSNAATTDTIDNLCAGVYTVTVTDAHGCSATINDTITEPPLLTATITASTNASCNGTCDGTATASGNGGTGPYTYSWSNGGATDTTTNLCAGIYTVTVTDAHGCTATVDDTITEPTVLVANIISSTDASCNGTCDGTATASGSGGTPPYTYSWNTTPGQTDSNAVNLCAGTYDVTVTDANGCTATVSDTINEPPVLTISITAQTDVSCFGVCDGTATATANGGTGPYSFSWSNGTSTDTATALCAGTYTVTVTDAHGCTATVDDTITEPAVLTVAEISHTDASCNGTCDGGILVTGNGGTAPYTYNWSNAATTDTIDNLCAGTYTVTVTDAHGCTATINDTITEPPLLTISITSSTNASCNGTCDGTATATVVGGTMPYSFLWSNNATGDTATALCAGVYTVTVTDAHGCTATVDDTITEPPVLEIVIAASTDASCNGTCDGSAVASATGGTFPYVYTWSNNAIGDTATALCAGVYTVTVTDANGCTATVNDTINEPPVLVGTLTFSNNVSCNGVCDGSAAVSASGGTGPYFYNWNTNPGQTTDTVTLLCAGVYTVTITDSHGCTTTVVDTITEPAPLTATIVTQTNVSCNGVCDGSVTASGVGGTAPYTYSWTNGGTADTTNNLCAGTYTVTVTDAHGCTATVDDTITEPLPLTISITDSTNASCNGTCDGAATATAVGGTAPYSFQWSNAATGDTAHNLCAGTYDVTVTDDHGCTATVSVTITEPTLLVISVDSTTNASCNGTCDGTAAVSSTGGTPPYTYVWNTVPSQTDSVATGLCAGTYTATVTDDHGCTDTISVTITEPAVLTATFSATDNVTCNGLCDGRIVVTPGGGTAPFTYLWSDGQTTDTATNLCAGTYTVTITDSHGCTVVGTDSVTQPPVLQMFATHVNNVSCNGVCDGTARVFPIGGTAPYFYAWSAPIVATTDTLSSLCAGTYFVTVTDNNGCSFVDSIVITEPLPLTDSIAFSHNLHCNGVCDGSTAVTPSGGTAPYTFNWSNGATTDTITQLCAGTYDVTVTDAHGCTTTASDTITEPPLLVSSVTSHTDVSCNSLCDGSAQTTTTGGTPPYTYLWNTPVPQNADSAILLCAGFYQATVTDSNGCFVVDTVTITQPDPLNINIDHIGVTCHGAGDGIAWATVTGGILPYTYTWSRGTQVGQGDTVVSLIPGTVSVTVTDAHGCTITISDSITEPTVLVANVTRRNVNCFGGNDGTIFVTVSGGTPFIGTAPYHYSWSDASGTQIGTSDTVTGLVAGVYHISVSDSHGCTDTGTVTITQPLAPLSDTMLATNIRCFGANDGAAGVHVSGGTPPYSHFWSAGIPFGLGDSVIGLHPGTVYDTIRDANGCQIIDSITITQPTVLALTIAVDSNTNCTSNTGGITVSLTGGTPNYNYVWTDASGNTVATTTASSQTTNSVTGLGVGQYTVVVTDSNGCSKQIFANIIEKPRPALDTVNIVSTTCGFDNGAISLTYTSGNPPVSYTWTPAVSTTNSASALAAGNYTVVVTDASGCDTTLSLVVPAIDKVHVDSTQVKDAYCGHEDGIIQINISSGTPPYQFEWSHDSTLNSASASSLVPGNYSVTVSDANHCDTIVSFIITDIAKPEISILPDTAVKIHKGLSVDVAVTLVSSPDSVSYIWTPSTGLTCDSCALTTAMPDETTTYQVIATDTVTGCTDTSFVTIIVKDEHNIFVPNAITPNGDGFNDVWVIRDLQYFPDNEIIILNRWGDEVFRAKPYNNDWGGTYNGKELPAATYYYVIKLNDTSESVTGTITIVK